MVLTTEKQINAALKPSRAVVTAAVLANSEVIDEENIRIGIYRKIRKAVLWNLDNNVVRFRFATQDAAGANDANLPLTRELTGYGSAIIEPTELTEKVLAILATTTVRRLSGYVELISGGLVTFGVELNVQYYDDLDNA